MAYDSDKWDRRMQKWLNPLEYVSATAIVVAVLVVAGLIVFLPLSRVQSQTIHPDIMWLYRLIENLDSRVKLLEETQRR